MWALDVIQSDPSQRRRRERQSLFSVYLKPTHTHTHTQLRQYIERKSNKDDPIRLSLVRIHTCRRLKGRRLYERHTHTQMIHLNNIGVQQRPTSEFINGLSASRDTDQRAILFYPMNSFWIPRILQVITHLLFKKRRGGILCSKTITSGRPHHRSDLAYFYTHQQLRAEVIGLLSQ